MVTKFIILIKKKVKHQQIFEQEVDKIKGISLLQQN